jgi:hypothetical protein
MPCPKCGGQKWLFWWELDHYCGPNRTKKDKTKYYCDKCTDHQSKQFLPPGTMPCNACGQPVEMIRCKGTCKYCGCVTEGCCEGF